MIELLAKNDAEFAAKAAIYARTKFGMRSITHLLAGELAKYATGKEWAKSFYEQIVYRPDDMTEIMAYYFNTQKLKLPNAMKKGFAAAFDKFDGYQLAKYRNANKDLKLVDVVNLIHPKPTDRNREALTLLVKNELLGRYLGKQIDQSRTKRRKRTRKRNAKSRCMDRTN